MGQIMAVVTLHKEKVGGGAPIFVAENEQDQQQTAFKLEKNIGCIGARSTERHDDYRQA